VWDAIFQHEHPWADCISSSAVRSASPSGISRSPWSSKLKIDGTNLASTDTNRKLKKRKQERGKGINQRTGHCSPAQHVLELNATAKMKVF
jgi:hypothetical protein